LLLLLTQRLGLLLLLLKMVMAHVLRRVSSLRDLHLLSRMRRHRRLAGHTHSTR
jgi:hypothetical protein